MAGIASRAGGSLSRFATAVAAAWTTVALGLIVVGSALGGRVDGALVLALSFLIVAAGAGCLLFLRRIRRALDRAEEAERVLQARNRELEEEVAARAAAERRLLKSRDRFETLVENATDLIAELDRDGRLTFASASHRELLGIEPSRQLGRHAAEVVHPDDAEKVRAEIARALRGERPEPIEVRLQTAADRYVWFESCIAQLDGEDGSPRLMGIARDITSRKEAEDRYRSLVDDSPLGVLTLDRELRVETANRAFARMAGAKGPEALIGLGLRERESLGNEKVQAALVACLENGEAATVDGEWTTPFGVDAFLRFHLAPLRDQVGRVQVICEDIAERKQLEEQLRQSQKMEAVGTLAGGVAHDFNNHLTVILGYVDRLRGLTQLDERIASAVDEIARAAERSAALTGQLLAFSRKQVRQPEIVDLHQLVARLEPMLRRILEEQVHLETLLDGKAVSVRADPSQLEQVLVNLVINARDAMPDGGTLTIEASDLAVGRSSSMGYPELEPGRYVVLAVSDSGKGMDRDTRMRAFEPFFTTKPEGSGTGLGLSMVYGIVKQTGGTVSISSALGEGTTVQVLLPAAEPAKPEKQGIAATCKLDFGGKETILLVEDETMVRSLVRQILEGQGYRVHEAGDGEEALEVAEPISNIDLLLTDVMMPRRGGRELAEELVRRRPEISVLYMSGYSEKGIVRNGELEPDVELLPKPFAPDELLARVRRVLDARTRQQASRAN